MPRSARGYSVGSSNKCAPATAPAGPPEWLRDRLVTADALTSGYERAVRWEIDRLSRAFLDSGLTWILLKGAGYIAAGLPPGRGRRVADIDVLVPRADLGRVEQILQEEWLGFPEINAYDNRYYREWMHELPPMVHRERRSVVDVHHGILPRTSRLKPSRTPAPTGRDARRRRASAGALPTSCLHAAAHLFHDGEIAGSHSAISSTSINCSRGSAATSDSGSVSSKRRRQWIWPGRSIYALRYTQRWFGTPLPDAVSAAMRTWAPPAPVRA
jgi:hypothetical protein